MTLTSVGARHFRHRSINGRSRHGDEVVAIAWYFIQRAIISTGTVFGAPPFIVNLIPALLLVAIAVWYYRRV